MWPLTKTETTGAHHLKLPNGESIPYLLERRSRRTVGLKINQSGLVVHAPSRISQSTLEQMLMSKLDWIIKKLHAQKLNQVETMQWQDGAELLLLGNQITLSVRPDTVSRAVDYQPGLLEVALPNTGNQTVKSTVGAMKVRIKRVFLRRSTAWSRTGSSAVALPSCRGRACF